jgi:hypothetical protein
MSTAKFLVYACCDEVHPKPAQAVCPGCEEPNPAWQDWVPEDEECPGIDQLTDIVVGLLMRLEERGELQEVDGRVPALVQGALILISQGALPNLYADFYRQPA